MVRECYIFKKFKESHKFVENVQGDWRKKFYNLLMIKLVKNLDRYPKLKKLSFLLNFIKDYPKNNKNIKKVGVSLSSFL